MGKVFDSLRTRAAAAWGSGWGAHRKAREESSSRRKVAPHRGHFGAHLGAHLGPGGPRVSLLASATLLGIALWGPSNLVASAAPASLPSPSALQPMSPDDSWRAANNSSAIGAMVGGGEVASLLTPPSPAGLEGALAGGGPQHTWQLLQGRYWQISGPAGEDPSVTDAAEHNRGSCSAGMVEVQGRMKVAALLDELQLQACTKWIDKKWPERCAAYDRSKWLAASKDLATQAMHFCIDRFEYPNRRGEYPIVMASWYEARDACKADGKRLCTEDEWTFACEGEEATPYPNGYERDPEACLNDRPWRQFHGESLMPRSGKAAMLELDRLWQGLPSGSRPLCRSSFGVYDLTGNIDEWTRSSIAGERPSVLKGGYWGPVRTRCRPATKAHDETHTFYQQGFRCCEDPR